MTTVVVGSNRFVDSPTLLAIRDQPLLRVTIAPVVLVDGGLRITLVTPPDTSPTVNVVDNVIASGSSPHTRVVASQQSVTILVGEAPVVSAVQLDAERVSVHIDLRPIGINVFDDSRALYIAGNHYSGNLFQGILSAAIRLG